MGSDARVDDGRAQTLRVFEVRDALGMARLQEEWRALHDASDAGPFSAWEWLHPWVQRIAPQTALRILCARDGAGALVGLLPLGLDVGRALGHRVRRLFLLGETHVGSDYLEVVALPSLRREVTRAFGLHLRDVQADWDVLDLGDLESNSPTPGWLREVLGDGDWAMGTTTRFTCPWEPLIPGEGFEAFLKRSGRRDNFNRRRKWFTQQPGFRIEVTREPDALALPAAAFFRLHAARWAGEGGSQGIRGAGVEAFHREAMQGLAERGWLRLYTLWIGERALASVYGIVHRTGFIYYQSGYDPAWRNRSPGLVLVGETFRDAIEAGLESYDFLRGTETYKADWARERRTTTSWRLTFRHGPGAWLTRGEGASRTLRNTLKSLLPSPAVELVRRQRRKASGIPVARSS